jgi:hypothetical protein
LVGWISGALGGFTAYRLLRRRPQVAVEPSSEPVAGEVDGRANELRAKLAESRAAEPVVEEGIVEQAIEEPPAEPVAEEPGPSEPESPEERRQRVHEEGRAALDEMKPE